MHAIVVASDSRLAHIVLRSLTGIVTGVSVIGEISWWWRIAHRRKFIPLKLDNSGASVKLLIQAVNRIAAVQAGCVVLPADTIASGMLTAAAPSLHCAIFPSPPRALLDTFNDKWLFHRLCLEHEVPTPKTFLIERKDASSSRGFMQTVQPPIVVKPTGRMAGEGVAVIANLNNTTRRSSVMTLIAILRSSYSNSFRGGISVFLFSRSGEKFSVRRCRLIPVKTFAFWKTSTFLPLQSGSLSGRNTPVYVISMRASTARMDRSGSSRQIPASGDRSRRRAGAA